MKKLIMHGRGYSFGPKPFNPLEDVTHWWQLDTSHYSNYTYTDLTGYTDKVLKNRRPTSTNISINADCTTVNAMYSGADLPNVYTDNFLNPFCKSTEFWSGTGCISIVFSWDGNCYSNKNTMIIGTTNGIGTNTGLPYRWLICIGDKASTTKLTQGNYVCLWNDLDNSTSVVTKFSNITVTPNEITVLQFILDLPNSSITCIKNNTISQTMSINSSAFVRVYNNCLFNLFHRLPTKTTCPSSLEIFTGSIYEIKFWNKIKSSSYLEEDYNRISERYGLTPSGNDPIYISLYTQLSGDVERLATKICNIGEEALGVSINDQGFYEGDPIDFAFFADFPEGTAISIQIAGIDMQNIATINGVSVDNSYSRTFNFTVNSQTEILDDNNNHFTPPQYATSVISALYRTDTSAQGYMYVDIKYTVPNGQPKSIGLDVYLN